MSSKHTQKLFCTLFVLLIGTSALVLLYLKAQTSDAPQGGSEIVDVVKSRDHKKPFAEKITLLPEHEISLELNQNKHAPIEDLYIIESLLHAYQNCFDEHPSGLNVDYVASLTGQNELGIGVLPSNHPAINKRGELQDRWGTPFFFHSVASDYTEIISAGPDRKLWTEDDIAL